MNKNRHLVEIKNAKGEVVLSLDKKSIRTIMRWMGIKSKKTKVIKRTIRRFLEKELCKLL